MSFQTFPINNSHWRRRRDVLRQNVPRPENGDLKKSIAGGWKRGTSDKKRWSRGRAETLTGLNVGRLVKFFSDWQQGTTEPSNV